MIADEMGSVSKTISYEYLIDAFGEEKIRSRYCFLEASAKRFLENIGL